MKKAFKYYKIVMSSMGGTRRDLITGLSYKRCLEMCKSYHWRWDAGYIWDLSIEEDNEANARVEEEAYLKAEREGILAFC